MRDIKSINQLTRERTRYFIDMVHSTLQSSVWQSIRPLQHPKGILLPFFAYDC